MANNNRKPALPHGNKNMGNVQYAVHELHQLYQQQEMGLYPSIRDQAASSFYRLPQQVPASYFGVRQAPPPLPCTSSAPFRVNQPPLPLPSVTPPPPPPPPPPTPLPNQVNGNNPANHQDSCGAHQGNVVTDQVGGVANQEDVNANQNGGADQADNGAVQDNDNRNQAGVGGLPNQAGDGGPPNPVDGGGPPNQVGDGGPPNQAGGGGPADHQADDGTRQVNINAIQAGRGGNRENANQTGRGDLLNTQAGVSNLPARGNLQRQGSPAYLQRHAPRGFLQGQVSHGYAHHGHAFYGYAPYGYAPYGHAPQYGVQYQLPHDQAFFDFRPSQPPVQDRHLLADYDGMHQGELPRVQLVIPGRVGLPQEQGVYRQVPGRQAVGGGGGGGPADHRAYERGDPFDHQAVGGEADDDQAADNAREQAMSLPLDMNDDLVSEPGSSASSVRRGRRTSAGRSRANRARSRGRGRGGNVIVYM